MSEKSWTEWTECKCPSCERIHNLNIYWTGNGTPRKFCKKCLHEDGLVDESFVYTDNPDIVKNKKKESQD